MNFSINSYYKSTPNFTALKFTKNADYSSLSKNELETLKQIKEEQEGFRHVDIEVGKFTDKVSDRPYFYYSSNPFDVVLNTRNTMAYANISCARTDNNFVKVVCDEYDKNNQSGVNKSTVTYRCEDVVDAENFARRINKAHNQIEKAKIFAELIETSNNLKNNEINTKPAEPNTTEEAPYLELQSLIASCEKV